VRTRIGIRIGVDAAGARGCERPRYRSEGVRSRRRIRREHEPRILRLSEFVSARVSKTGRDRERARVLRCAARAQRTACARVQISRAEADPLCSV